MKRKNTFTNCKLVLLTAMSALALSCFVIGCDREVSKTESSTVSSDGTVKTKEKKVTQDSDGKVTTTETKKSSTPDKP